MFCSKCGTMLPDGAKFCSSCGSPVAAPNPVYTTPVVEPAPSNEQVYQSPVIESVEIPASETATKESSATTDNEAAANSEAYASTNDFVENVDFTAPVNETPVMEAQFTAPKSEAPSMEAQFTAPVNEAPSMEAQFTSPVNEAPSMEPAFTNPVNEVPVMNAQFTAPASEPIMNAQFTAPTNEPAMSFNNQPGFNGGYSQPQNATYTNPTFVNANENGNAAPNPQPVYQNPMGVYPDNSQNWGPLMPPKKKSKAPIIIALSIIALLIVAAVVACCLIFCGKKEGAGSAEDALIAAFDAFSDDDDEAALNAMHPLFNAMCDALDDLGSTYEALGLSSDALIGQLIDTSNPKSGGFKYSNLKITDRETMDKDDIDDYNENIRSSFNTYNVYFNAVGIDIGDIEDYMCEAAVTYEGTVDIDKTEYSFMAAIVKIDGNWYVATISSYEN